MANAPGYSGGKLPAQKKSKKPSYSFRNPAAPTGSKPLSPLAQAQALVRQEMAPYYQQLSQQQAEQEAYENRKRQAIQGFTQALISSLQGDVGGINQAYEHAIAQTSGLAAQSAAALSSQNPNPQGQALLQAIGAPESQQAAMAQGLGATYGGGAGVLQHTEGTIPSQTFSQNQLAQVLFARGLPSLAAMKGIGALQEYGYQSAEERKKLADKRLEIAAQEPSLIEKTRSGIISEREKRLYQQATLATKAADLKRKERESAFKQGLELQKLNQRDRALAYQQYAFERTQGYKEAQGSFNAWYKRQGLVQRGEAQAQRKLQNDRVFQNQLRSLGIREEGLKQRAEETEWKRRNKGKPGGYTAGQLSKLRKDAFQRAQQAYNGYWALDADPNSPLTTSQLRQIMKDNDVTDPSELEELGYFKRSYQETLLDLINVGVPLLVAQTALNRYWRQPGQTMPWETAGHGRPKRSFQQRRKKR
jgi:hypothetical protein